MKWVFFFICLFFSFFVFASSTLAKTPAHVVLINQVRGTECCEAGSRDHLSYQLDQLNSKGLSSTFALRYDALGDPGFADFFKLPENASHDVGVFLEVTPNLARDAGVAYVGPVEKWYKAKNAYLVGYSSGDRKKLIDTAFARYHQVFGRYPTSTVAWVIDPISLSYMQSRYGVRIHEITREQFSTDSYTLYGGPWNIPYYPSKNWALIPATTASTALPVLIVRQTLTDPVRTYGDVDAVHTSQPNDYMKGGYTFSYFEKLLENVLTRQQPYGFAVIGLENSMDQRFQEEYGKQLSYLLAKQEQGILRLYTAKDFSFANVAARTSTTLSLFYGHDSQENNPVSAYWIQAPNYRVRLVEKGNVLMFSDLRVYSQSLSDPYRNEPLSSLNAYWITPFFLDASRYAPHAAVFNTSAAGTQNSAESGTIKKPGFAVNDIVASHHSGIVLPEKKSGSDVSIRSISPTEIQFTYTAKRDGTVTLSFRPASFVIRVPENEQLYYELNSTELEALSDNSLMSWGRTVQESTTTFTPTIKTADTNALHQAFPKQLSPELAFLPVHPTISTFTIDSTRAVAGRNLIRAVVHLRDEKGNPTLAKEELDITAKEGAFENVTVHQPEASEGQYFFDIESTKPGRFTPVLHVDGHRIELPPVRFIANCRKQPLYCALRPWELVSYLQFLGS